MKKILFSLLAGVTLFATACENTEEPKNPTLETPDSEVIFLYDQTVPKSAAVILTDVEDYTVDTEYQGDFKDWLKVEKKIGRIEITPLSQNGEKMERVAILKVSAEGVAEVKEIKVRHAYHGEVVITLSVKNMEFGWDMINVDQYSKVTVNATDYDVEIQGTDGKPVDWLSFTKDGKNLLIRATKEFREDNGMVGRSANVLVSADSQSPQVIQVLQKNYVENDSSLLLTPSHLVFPKNAANWVKTVTATTNFVPVKAKVTTPGADAWMNVTVADLKLTVTVLNENPSTTDSRLAAVEVENAKGVKAMLVVEQTAQNQVEYDLAGEWNFTAETSKNGMPAEGFSQWDNVLQDNVIAYDENGFKNAQAISGKVQIEKTEYGFVIKAAALKGIGEWRPYAAAAAPFWAGKETIVPEIPITATEDGLLIGHPSLRFGDFWSARTEVFHMVPNEEDPTKPDVKVVDITATTAPTTTAETLFTPSFTSQYFPNGGDATKWESQYAFGNNMNFMTTSGNVIAANPVAGYNATNVPVSYMEDTQNQTLTFAKTYTASDLNNGNEVEVVYTYYHVKSLAPARSGMFAQPEKITTEAVDFLRNIVLTRPVTPPVKR